MALPSRIPGSDGMGSLLCLCWCGENYVWVSSKDVREGVTGLCGLRGCAAPKEAA